MEKINVIGVWPVGLVGGLMVERPICDNITKKVVGFNAVWKPDRPFPMDMASFALNLKVILDKKDAFFSYQAKSGYQETMLLQQMVTRDQLEPLADCCTKVRFIDIFIFLLMSICSNNLWNNFTFKKNPCRFMCGTRGLKRLSYVMNKN